VRYSVPEDPRRAAFDAQATASVLDKLYRAARARMRAYAGRTRHVNDADVDDMVMSILSDTLDGTLIWHHETKPLLRHLLDTARYRVRNAAHKRWREKVRVKHVADEDEGNRSLAERVVAGARPEPADDALALCEIADQVVADLRVRIAGDPDVERFFDAIVNEHALTRAEIMQTTGMSARQYANARERLTRIVLQLPSDVRETVMSAFTN
jgi:hypothetical protein